MKEIKIWPVLLCGLATAHSVSRQVQIEGVDYFIPPDSVAMIRNYSGVAKDLALVTVIQNASDETAIRGKLDLFNSTDDVWSPSFASALVLDSTTVAPYSLEDCGVDNIFHHDGDLPEGPYFLDSVGSLFQAYRLYPDTNQAFLQASYQTMEGEHRAVPAAISQAAGQTIAVPSRLYFTKTSARPLAGVRIGVKDLYDLKGLRTSGGNRALFAMRQAKNQTAPAIQRLIDAGAVIVGKQKLSEFAYAGAYIVDHVDYLMPFNPRGDGYQSASDSSGGSAAAIASYEWLDASIGSDTGGSIRGPALANGVHGNRPSYGAVTLEGAIPLSSSMDTCGTLARDPAIWNNVNKVLYHDFAKSYQSFPSKIYIDASADGSDGLQDWWNTSMVALNKMASYMNATIEPISVDKLWNSTSNSSHVLADTLGPVYGELCAYDQWNEFGRAYIDEYKQSHNGHLPHMAPGTLSGWQKAEANITADDIEEARTFQQEVATWSSSHFLVTNNKTCSEAIHISFKPPGIMYKLDVSGAIENPSIAALRQASQKHMVAATKLASQICMTNGTLPEGVDLTCEEVLRPANDSDNEPHETSMYRFASVAGLPHYSITLGAMGLGAEAGDSSTYSVSWDAPQALPYGMTLMAEHGCDFMLQDLISGFYEAGIIAPVTASIGS